MVDPKFAMLQKIGSHPLQRAATEHSREPLSSDSQADHAPATLLWCLCMLCVAMQRLPKKRRLLQSSAEEDCLRMRNGYYVIDAHAINELLE